MKEKIWRKWQFWPKNVISQIFQRPYNFISFLGDATEEFIETLTNKDSENQDEEEIYKMANVMSDNNGLKVMLNRLEHIKDLSHSKQLLMVLLKLFGYCVRVKKNREKFLDPGLRYVFKWSIQIFLNFWTYSRVKVSLYNQFCIK